MTDRANLKTAVLLCADSETLGHGLDLKAVQEWLQDTMPGVHVQLAPNLDDRPGEITGAVTTSDAARLVLGLCSAEYPTSAMQVQARKAGLDPLGIELVNLGTNAALTHPRLRAIERAKILLAAAVARARAFPGSRPENAKPSLPAKVSRRSLFSPSLLEYRSVPSILGSQCAASSGCGMCVQVCPCGALTRANGHVTLDKSLCGSCGLCLTACPRTAIQFPTYAPAQVVAQITTLLDPALGTLWPRGILFTCQRSALVLGNLAKKRFSGSDSRTSASSVEPSQVSKSVVELFPVLVPCLGMVSATWLLGCLTVGAAAVGLAPCPGQCPFRQKEAIEGKVAYCRELLRLLGDSSDRIGLLRSISEGIPGLALKSEFEHETRNPKRGTWNQPPAQVLLQLARDCQASEGLALAHPYSPFGAIEVTDDCTGCGVCTAACPTGALALERKEGSLSLTFDAGLCTACGQCITRCPEAEKQVLRLQQTTDLRRISRGRVSLYQDRDCRCEACGVPIASETMVRRIRTILGDGNAPTLDVLSQYCPNCRMRFASAEPAVSTQQGERTLLG